MEFTVNRRGVGIGGGPRHGCHPLQSLASPPPAAEIRKTQAAELSLKERPCHGVGLLCSWGFVTPRMSLDPRGPLGGWCYSAFLPVTQPAQQDRAPTLSLMQTTMHSCTREGFPGTIQVRGRGKAQGVSQRFNVHRLHIGCVRGTCWTTPRKLVPPAIRNQDAGPASTSLSSQQVG